MKKLLVLAVTLLLAISAVTASASGDKNRGTTGSGTTSTGSDSQGSATQSRSGR